MNIASHVTAELGAVASDVAGHVFANLDYIIPGIFAHDICGSCGFTWIKFQVFGIGAWKNSYHAAYSDVGKFFNTGVIKPRGFIEYVPENLKPGNYSFYSSTDPQIKGQLVVIPN